MGAGAAHGGVGCISVTANVAPRLCAEFQAATLAGDYAKALEYQDRLMPLHEAIFLEPGVAGAKYGLSLLGRCSDAVRLPLVGLSDGTKAQIDAGIDVMGIGDAAASLVGQALGRGDPDDAKAWGWDVAKLATVVVGVMSLVGLFFPDLLLRPFLHDPETLALARLPLRFLAATMSLDTLGMVLMNALTGVGDTKRVMYIGIAFQWLIFLPLVYLLGPILGFGLVVIFATQAAYRALQALTFASMWQRGRWQTIELH